MTLAEFFSNENLMTPMSIWLFVVPIVVIVVGNIISVTIHRARLLKGKPTQFFLLGALCLFNALKLGLAMVITRYTLAMVCEQLPDCVNALIGWLVAVVFIMCDISLYFRTVYRK